MNKNLSKVISMSAASMMLMSMAMSASADAGSGDTPVTGVVTGSKLIKIQNSIDFEGAEIKFQLSGDADSVSTAIDDKVVARDGVVDGVKVNDNGVESDGTFTLTFAADSTPYYMDGDNEYKYYWNGFELDFSEVEWEEPGLYVYSLTETDNAGYTADGTSTYYIEVGVENNLDENGDIDNTDGMKISGVNLYENGGETKVGADASSDDDSYELYTDKECTDENKVDAASGIGAKGDLPFVNEYSAFKKLDLTTVVKGNQASKNDEFSFTITLGGAEEDSYNIVKGTNKTAIAGNGSATITLKDSEDAYIYLPAGIAWEITETDTKYDESYKIDDEDVEEGLSASGTMGDEDVDVEFINKLNGTIPTGVLLSVAPFAMLGLAGIGGTALILKKKKEND